MGDRRSSTHVVSPDARLLITHLQSSLLKFEAISSDFDARLFHAIEVVSDRAILIEPTSEMIRRSLAEPIIADRPII